VAAMQGVRTAAVQALQGVDNAAAGPSVSHSLI
jgi:hypothetical protein